MKYVVQVYSDEQSWISVEWKQSREESTQPAHQFKATGQYLAPNPMRSAATAISVSVGDGKRLVTDGPFAETHEQIGG